jgi:hypothetical protein
MIAEIDKYEKTLRSSTFYKKNPPKLIELIFKGEIPTRDFPSSSGAFELDGIFRSENLSKNQKSEFFNFIFFLSKKNVNILENIEIIRTLLIFYNNKDNWVRDYNSWKKSSYNLDKQIKSLARHLFCLYSIPKFMDNIWFNKNIPSWYIELFIFLGKGFSPRKFEKLTVPITRKETHYFLSAPENYNPIEAILWAKIHGFGGDERLVNPIMESKIYRCLLGDVKDKEKSWNFWETILKFFIEQPLIDTHIISPICDYISHVKYEYRQIPNPGGGFKFLAPENSDFKINGRTIEALVKGMEKWHKQIGGKKGDVNLKNWKGLNIEDYQISFGKEQNKRTYYFTQLISSASIKMEGRVQRHCVAGYINSCANGKTSIWSMSITDYIGINKNLLTIEISPDKRIVQCRGKLNRLANKQEWSIIERFAYERNLTIPRWVTYS